MKKKLLITISAIFLFSIFSFAFAQKVSAGECISAGYKWDGCTSCECDGDSCKKWECYYYCYSCVSGTYQGCVRADDRLRRANCSASSCSPRCDGGGGCGSCTPGSCSTGSTQITKAQYDADSTYAYVIECSNGSGCTPSRRYCRWETQNLCSSASTSTEYLRSGQSSTVTATANTNVNTFKYTFYNIDNGNAPVCSSSSIAGWATTQGACPAGTYQLIRTNYYASARSSESTTFPADSIFINDASWGGQQVRNLQIVTTFQVDGRPPSSSQAACTFNQRSCSPLCSPSACGPTYYTSDQGFGSTTFSCDNSPSQCGSETRTCYCQACPTASCAPNYDTINHGFGSVVFNCTNNCGVSSSRTCYIDSCSNCILPNCPSPLTDTATTTNPNMVLEEFRSCSKSQPCGGSRNYGSCYEQVSPQPTISLQVFPDGENKYGFLSSTHTGNRMPDYNLNDPIRITATYTDANGANDIEAVSVWFRDSTQTGEIPSPLWIDTSADPTQPPRSPSDSSWGFLMRYESSSWVPYVPSYPSGGDAKWIRAVYLNNSFVISGPTGLQMVRITIGHNLQSSITRSGNSVTMPFQVSFDFESGYDNVAQTEYDIYLMGNDIFSFTPNDNYGFSVDNWWSPGQLRYRTSYAPAQLYARQWSLSGYRWNVDKGLPEVDNLYITVEGETNLRLHWRVTDAKDIYAVVGNMYASLSTPEDASPLTITPGPGASSVNVVSPYTLSTDSDDLSKLNTGYTFRRLDIGSTAYEGSIDINIGENKEGSLVIYLTVFDRAGNMYTRPLTYSLGDWIATYAGLAYSSQGVDYEVRNIGSEDAWDSTDALSGLNPLYADVSTELFGDSSSSGTSPAGLDRSNQTGSYHIRPFTMNNNISSMYEELSKAYGDREIEGKADMSVDLPAITKLNGSLNGTGSCLDSSSVCILKYTGDFNVGDQSEFLCNKWGVFFIDGSLTIHRSIKNTNSNKDACIFVVSGNVTIKEGEKESSAGQLQYDEINAYIIADGSITIDAEYEGAKFDGVYIGGGLYALNRSGNQNGIIMNRTLKLIDRNVYPALFVEYHSKYSVLSNIVFGSQIDILKTELGYKPY